MAFSPFDVDCFLRRIFQLLITLQKTQSVVVTTETLGYYLLWLVLSVPPYTCFQNFVSLSTMAIVTLSSCSIHGLLPQILVYLKSMLILRPLMSKVLTFVESKRWSSLKTVPIFLYAAYSTDRFSRFSKLFEDSTSIVSKSWKPFAFIIQEKSSSLAVLDEITISHEVAPSLFLLFLDSDVSEKMWPIQLPLNKKGFTPKEPCGFTSLCSTGLNITQAYKYTIHAHSK